MALNNRQRKFCEEYVVDRNATRAAKVAGYSHKNPHVVGCQLLKTAECKDYIELLDQEIRERNKITKDRIIKDVLEIRDRCMQKVPVMTFDRVEKEWVQVEENGEGVWQFDAANALKACDMLAKHIGFYEADKVPTANVNILNAPNVDDIRRIKRMLDE